MTISIRPARAGDVADIGQIAEATDLFPAEMLDDMIAGYLNYAEPVLWFVAEDDGVLGFGFCEPERMADGAWNLLAIGISPDHQGKGIGAAMLGYLKAALLTAKARILIVETLGTDGFQLTREFYLKNGFDEEARIRDFYEDGGDKVVFWKRISR